MHVLIPFAATLDPACRQAFDALKLPQLGRLLATLAPGPIDAASEFSLTPAHERVQARWQGLPLQDGRAPFAAVAALGAATQLCPAVAADKQTHTPHGAWAFITPCHWVLGQDHVSMGDPDDLELSPQHSDQLRQSMQPYFAEDAIDLFPYQASTWLARSDFFSGLACASSASTRPGIRSRLSLVQRIPSVEVAMRIL